MANKGYPRWVENMGHDPVYVESESHRQRLMKERGLRDATRHVTAPDTDKNPYTQSFDVGVPAAHDTRPFCQLSKEEQAVRHQEWLDLDIKLGIV